MFLLVGMFDNPHKFQYHDFMSERISSIPDNTQPPAAGGEVVDADTLAMIEAMPKEAIISLIRRVSGAIWGIGCMNDEQVADAMLLRLAYEGLTTKDSKTMLAAIGEWLDRVKGKAVQPVVGSMKLSYEPLVIRGMYD